MGSWGYQRGAGLTQKPHLMRYPPTPKLRANQKFLKASVWSRVAPGVSKSTAIVLSRLYANLRHFQTVRLDFDFQSLSLRFRQPAVRYRPGFLNHWRYYRGLLQRQIAPLSGYRQHRLSRFIAKTRRVASFSYFRVFRLTPKVLAQQSLLLYPSPIQLGGSQTLYYFLNGLAITNPYRQTYVGDFVSFFGPDFCGRVGGFSSVEGRGFGVSRFKSLL